MPPSQPVSRTEFEVLFPVDEKIGLRRSVDAVRADLDEALAEELIKYKPRVSAGRREGRRFVIVTFFSEKDAMAGRMKAEHGT